MVPKAGTVRRLRGGVVSGDKGMTSSGVQAALPPVSNALARKVKFVFVAVIAGVVRGDLDSIVMKCLEKDRARR
jgi:hypothetical protein